MRPPTGSWPDFHEWVRQRFGEDFMGRVLYGAHCKLSTHLVYYPVLDQVGPLGSYALKAMTLAEKEGIRARY